MSMSMDLETRLGVRHKVGNTFRSGIETFLEGVKHGSKQVIEPYISILRHPEKPFYALGDIVKNVAELPVDFYHYFKGNGKPSFGKKVSRSLALAEAVVLLYGANKGAHLISNVSDNGFVQAGIGGLLGSEVTTAAVFFATYMAFSSVINLKSKNGKGAGCKLMSAVKETCKVSLISIPAGLLSFTSADLGMASIAVLLGVSSGAAATIGAVGGALLYTGTAKVAVHNYKENGHLEQN